jgi:hypothetical protein
MINKETNMKHNKKRNTAFLYECLIRELTKAIVQENKTKQTKVKGLLREFFSKGKPLKQELDLYSSILESKEMDRDYSKRFLTETKKDFNNLDRKSIFNEQTSLISKINKVLNNRVFSNFVPNYKDLATVGLFLQDNSLKAKKRIMLEDKMLGMVSGKEEVIFEMQHVDKLEFHMFVKRFNDTYKHSLLKEQKELLSNFITSFADNGLGLKYYLNEEIGRLKSAFDSKIDENNASKLNENFKRVRQKLDNYAKAPLTEASVTEIFYIQDLLSEVQRDVD